MRPERQARPREEGFTLIEVMLAVAILASTMALLWGSFSMTSKSKRKAEAIADRYQQIRLALQRMTREISQSYLSKNDMPGTVWPRTFFTSEKKSPVDELTFSSFSHVRLQENAKECDQSVVRYFAAPDREDRSRTHLWRRESRRLGGERPGEQGAAQVMLEDVVAVAYEFFDEVNNEWKETWNTRSADGQPDRLPTKVRINLTVKDEHDKPLKLATATRIFMRDALWFSVAQ